MFSIHDNKPAFNWLHCLVTYRRQPDLFQCLEGVSPLLSRLACNSAWEWPYRVVKDTWELWVSESLVRVSCGLQVKPAFMWVSTARWAQVWMVVKLSEGGNSLLHCKWVVSIVLGHLPCLKTVISVWHRWIPLAPHILDRLSQSCHQDRKYKQRRDTNLN